MKGWARPYGVGEKGPSEASRSRGERSRWQPLHGDPPLAVAALEAKIFRLRRGCGGRKLLVIFRSVGPAAGKWRVLTNARSCARREAGVGSRFGRHPEPPPARDPPFMLPRSLWHRTHGTALCWHLSSRHPSQLPQNQTQRVRTRARALQGSVLEF